MSLYFRLFLILLFCNIEAIFLNLMMEIIINEKAYTTCNNTLCVMIMMPIYQLESYVELPYHKWVVHGLWWFHSYVETKCSVWVFCNIPQKLCGILIETAKDYPKISIYSTKIQQYSVWLIWYLHGSSVEKQCIKCLFQVYRHISINKQPISYRNGRNQENWNQGICNSDWILFQRFISSILFVLLILVKIRLLFEWELSNQFIYGICLLI